MSEAAENEDIQEDINDDIKEEANPAEEKARASGWKPADEWEQDDPKKPDEIMSAEMFNARGEFIGRLKNNEKRMSEMETSFNTRMDNANKLHSQQMELQKGDLERKRDEAIDLADKDSALQYQGEIDKINSQPVQESAPNTGQATLDEWNKSNTWIYQNSPKSAYAQSQLNLYTSQGVDPATALASVDQDLAREFPAVNKQRDNHPTSEGGSKPGGKRSSKSLSMGDLTQEEARIWKISGNNWKSEKEFLQSVQDVRSES